MHLVLGPCKAGYYCSPNSSKELPCKEGTYSNVTGLFDKSGCKTCPLNAYCPSGSPLPIPCPASNFLPARRTKIKIFEGKISEDECRWCPVDPCDENGKHVRIISGLFYHGDLHRSDAVEANCCLYFYCWRPCLTYLGW